MRLLSIILAAVLSAAVPGFAAGKAEHVVVVVWDGMRPDFVNETNTPTLYQLAHEGVFFQNHHAVYLCSTEVNGTAIATGCYPNRSGILANREYRPTINPLKPVDVQDLAAVRKGDDVTHNHYLQVPTLEEILQHAGRRTVIAGAKPVVLLHDRLEQGRICADCVNLFEHATVPAAAVEKLDLPAFTPKDIPNTRQDEFATHALIGPLWDKGVPAFSLLWLSEPDATQHNAGLGTVRAFKALKGSDDNLARVLQELTARGVRDKTDVFVISDHGFSTTSRSVDIAAFLKKAGFNAVREFLQPPVNDDILAIGNGGTELFYVVGHDSKLTHKIVELLQAQDFTGAIFTRETMAGTFTLDQVRINTSDAPDIALSFRWTTDKNTEGIAGSVISDGGNGPGRGVHTSLSPFDRHNTLVAAGPDFRKGLVNQLPSGNIDLAPTVLHILGVPSPEHMDGRVLSEALASETSKSPDPVTQTLNATADLGATVWQQYLRVTEFGGTTYLEEANGHQEPRK
ncbi:MAG TPA: alkaline phosphatase family protein [Verrucomicrobiae bacterium]|nr:alkaline phosphatase family protein [Verrucomicrobiae bacterium]